MDQPDEQAQLRRQLDAAIDAAGEAYRHNTRLIRVLAVLGQPALPEELVEQTLIVLSQVFSADVAAMIRAVGGRLVVASACGIAQGDPAFTVGWPLSGGAAEALSGERTVARVGEVLAPADVPPSLAEIAFGSGVWIPLAHDGRDRDELLLILRRSAQPYSSTELQMLSSVASRLRVALEARERGRAIERLAQSGHRLTRYLELPDLYAEASRLLPHLVDAGSGAVVGVPEDGMQPEVPGWDEARCGDPYRGVHDGQAVLSVPVMRRGRPVALLVAFRDARRPFGTDAVEIATIFAAYVGAALTNTELYRALRDNEASLRLITDSISDLIAVVDAAGRFVYVSPSHRRELAHDQHRLLGTAVTDWVHSDDRARVRTALADAAAASKVEYRLRTGDGTWSWVESALRPAPSADNTVVLSSRVIDDRKRLEDELRTQATHDPLTGLANRTLTGQRLDEALAAAGPRHVGLLFCDLDKFKQVNDRLGHEAGDELLQRVADRLRVCLRPGDLLARFGGDEFVVVLDGVEDLDAVTHVGARVVRALNAPFPLRGEQVEVGASVGGVLGFRGRSTASAMLRDADAAMYTAKSKGSGLVEVFDEAASNHSLDRLEIRSELSRALDRDELWLQYQPIFDLGSGRIRGFEALLRWRHPTRGAIPPDVFIPLAEESGAIGPIGNWVLAAACRQLAEWHRLPGWESLELSVNLSPIQLTHPNLGAYVLDTIAAAGVRPTDVWLEITEHSSIRADVTQLATTLRAAGIRFALDDFGIAYSNLSHLKRLPIEALKIDRSFVSGLTAKDTDRGIVRAILAIADSLGLSVVAEGIETPEQRTALLDLGCGNGQGYLLSRPLSPPDATALLHQVPPPVPLPRRLREVRLRSEG